MMAVFGPVISAVVDFLNDAQRLGLVKEFNLIQSDSNYDEISGTGLLVSEFLKKLNDISANSIHENESILDEGIPAKNSSSDDEYVFVEEEKISENECTPDSPAKENFEFSVNNDEVSNDSFNSCVDEQMNKDEKIDVSLSTEKMPFEKIVGKDELDDPIKKNLVQINVDTNEDSKQLLVPKDETVQVGKMKRRISAFISRKRKEVDEWNVQEFCGRSYIDEQDPAWEQLDSCARVDAVFVPRRGCKSHIKVSRVQNVWGPQTHWQPEIKKIKQEPGEVETLPNDATLQAMDERLQILETHLKLKTDSELRKNLFKRIKMLEDKILLIESTSPEYLNVLYPDFSPKKMKNSEEKINLNNVDEIQKRIEALKNRLKLKAL